MTTARQMPTHDLVSNYVLAKHEVVRAGFVDEIGWQGTARLADVTANDFMREAAWVVLSAGMAERVVRNKFDALADAMHQWNAVEIARDEWSGPRALQVFAHRGKVAAIVEIAGVVAEMDGPALRSALRADAEGFLRTLPYIGPVTWAHLAKNLGLPVAKADRHLSRLSDIYQRTSVQDLCDEISAWLNEPVAVVDVVLWRYGAIHAQHCRRLGCRGVPHELP